MSDCHASNANMAHLLKTEEKRAQERRRHLLYLIVDFLSCEGYSQCAEGIVKAANLSPNMKVCDNIFLGNILQEYMDYYYAKFDKYPKICKTIEFQSDESFSSIPASNSINKKKKKSKCPIPKVPEKTATNELSKDERDFAISIKSIFPSASDGSITYDTVLNDNTVEKILKPLDNLYPPNSEWREIAENIAREIVVKNLNVHWSDIVGLEECKTCLKEVTVYPLKYPELFAGKFEPWKGVLLYGPPGTGKTMMVKAVATESKSTFFNITSSSIISKWRGDSEKYVRVLFELADYYAPSIIFIDEIDWLATKYDNGTSSSEPARRFRAELLARLDGLLSVANSKVTIVGATNVPWNIDAALLRRLERAIFVELPDKTSRKKILLSHIKPDLHNHPELELLVSKTEGFSCADLKLLCKEAWMTQMHGMWLQLDIGAVSLSDISNDGINDYNYFTTALHYVNPMAKTIDMENNKYKMYN